MTREAGAEESGLDAADPKNREVGLSTKVTRREAFLGIFFFFFFCSTAEAGGGT